MAKSDVTLVVGKDVADAIRGMTEVVGKMQDIERQTRKTARASKQAGDDGAADTRKHGEAWREMGGIAASAVTKMLGVTAVLGVLDQVSDKLDEVNRKNNEAFAGAIQLATLQETGQSRDVTLAVQSRAAAEGIGAADANTLFFNIQSSNAGDLSKSFADFEAATKLVKQGVDAGVAGDAVGFGRAQGLTGGEILGKLSAVAQNSRFTVGAFARLVPDTAGFSDVDSALGIASALSLSTTATRAPEEFRAIGQALKLPGKLTEAFGLDALDTDLARVQALAASDEALTMVQLKSEFGLDEIKARSLAKVVQAERTSGAASKQSAVSVGASPADVQDALDRALADFPELQQAMRTQEAGATITAAQATDFGSRRSRESQVIQQFLGAFAARNISPRFADPETGEFRIPFVESVPFVGGAVGGLVDRATNFGVRTAGFNELTKEVGLLDDRVTSEQEDVVQRGLVETVIPMLTDQLLRGIREDGERNNAVLREIAENTGAGAASAESTALNTEGGEVLAPNVGAGT